MSLPDSYIQYDKRRHGMDHDRYPWSNIFDRAPIAWPGGKSVAVAVVVSLEWFPILPEDQPFRAPNHMQTPYPDYRHYSSRDYGTRIGFYRLLETFSKHGIRASIATNSAIAQRHPEIIADILADGHEIVAHATDMNATIAGGMDAERHAQIIAESVATLTEATGTAPRGWLSIARSQAMDTPDILARNGIEYMLDWVNDELPYLFDTTQGPIVNLPLNHELSDQQIIKTHHQSMDSMVRQLEDAYDWLADEAGQYGGRMLPLHLTPYISGLPYRIDALDALLGTLAKRSDSWFATTGEIVDASFPALSGKR